MATPHELVGRATTWATGAPLTLSFSLDPSPTETGTAVASAYSQLEQFCGTALAQVVQDVQALYDNRHNLDTPVDPTDNDFLVFADQMPQYKNAKTSCDNAEQDLDAAVHNADEAASPTSTAPPAQSTTPGGMSPSTTNGGSLTPTTSGSGSSSDPPSASQTNGGDHHGPAGLLFLVGVVLLFS
ncbi:hypothetical protein FB451DRAFT_1213621 [Mycena latifolia]|nr:hypothetical protein FB451DRAFT_1213621 [Mycena latifolia]